jgi:hypothetical protein
MIVSPPHEIKVRLIRKGVEDLQWQTPVRVVQADDAVREDAALVDPADLYEEDDLAEFLRPETPASGLTKDDVVASDGVDNSQDVVSESREEEPESGTSPSRAHVLPVHGRDSDSDGAEREKGIKRKFGARAISGNLIRSVEPLKRQRDDPDKDDNPRETKRPSPPPETAAPSSETGFKLVRCYLTKRRNCLTIEFCRVASWPMRLRALLLLPSRVGTYSRDPRLPLPHHRLPSRNYHQHLLDLLLRRNASSVTS